MAVICVFCGSRTGQRPEFQDAANELGRYLASRQHTMVYGGGSTGMMGHVADAMLADGGQIIG
ncbi:MAG: TIGR00730 family Rossman fold protein, partial [Planctomycetaceae bacterium]|nr:TIGR00730 family Rossman fold protein [Planctomycetaceae bacterium]